MEGIKSLMGRYERLRPEIERVRSVVIPWARDVGVEVYGNEVVYRGGVVQIRIHPALKLPLRPHYETLLTQIRAQGVFVSRIL